MAQKANQSYDCGNYGAGSYGSNDCVTAPATPTQMLIATPPVRPIQSPGGLPDTDAQLVWADVIGLSLILLGIELSRRRRRTASSRGRR